MTKYEFEGPRRAHVLNFITMFGPASIEKIKESIPSDLGGRVRTVESVLDNLMEEGLVKHVDNQYSVVVEGNNG